MNASFDHLPSQAWIDAYGGWYGTNGYARPPWRIYRAFLSVLADSGKVLELGCGNALLLRFLHDHAPRHGLIPFGVDINRDAVQEARTKIFPDRPEAFVHDDIRRTIPFSDRFDLIFVNPLNADPGYYEQVDGKIPRLHFDGAMERLIANCWSALSPNGRLYLWCYDGHLVEIAAQLTDFRQLLEATNLSFEESPRGPVNFWISRCKSEAA